MHLYVTRVTIFVVVVVSALLFFGNPFRSGRRTNEDYLHSNSIAGIPPEHRESTSGSHSDGYTFFDDVLMIVHWNHGDRYDINYERLNAVYTSYFPNMIHVGTSPPKDPQRALDIYVSDAMDSLYSSYYGLNLMMEEFPHYRGYLWMNFDMFLNPYAIEGLDKDRIWFQDGSTVMRDDNNREADIKAWYHWGKEQWGLEKCRLAVAEIPDKYKIPARKRLAIEHGHPDFLHDYCMHRWSDAIYIPNRKRDEWLELSTIFLKHSVHLEIALPTILSYMERDGPTDDRQCVRECWTARYCSTEKPLDAQEVKSMLETDDPKTAIFHSIAWKSDKGSWAKTLAVAQRLYKKAVNEHNRT